MKLPPGITGFFDGGSSFQMMDSKKFRSICYDVSLHPAIKLLTIQEATYPVNYICAKFVFYNEPIQVVMNAYYPLFTATVIAENGHFVFCDLPEEFRLFEKHYQCITVEDLDKIIEEHYLEQLSEVERQQVAFWKPERLGEVIFNAWD